MRATVGKSSGKWYFEILVNGYLHIGLASLNAPTNNYFASHAEGWGYSSGDGKKWNDNTPVVFGDSYGTNDVIGIAFDMDAGRMWWALNGVWQAGGDPATNLDPAYTNLSGTLYPAAALFFTATFATIRFNPISFSYSAPSGFSHLCT